MIKLRRRKQQPKGAARPGQGAGAGARPPGVKPQVVRGLRKEVEALRKRVTAVEQELHESRQLNKRLAEITDVVAEVLLPAEQRDEERLRKILKKYESTL